MKYNIRYIFRSMALLATMGFASCSENIELCNSVDESPYMASTQLNGLLLDESTNKNSSVVEMTEDEYSTNIVFRLSKLPQKGVDVKIAFDESYADIYNAAHDTDFELFPAANVKIHDNGELLLAPDEKNSPSVEVTLTAFDGMDEDKTYLVPLAASSPTEGVTIAETSKHMVLLVEDIRNRATTYKGEDAVKTVLYFEVSDTNPLNALEFRTASGKYFFDHIVLFSANIRWDSNTNRVVVHNNDQVQYLLDHNDEYLQPLRDVGMKIIICILGDRTQAGPAQLSDMGAKEFARELAAYCKTYHLDGVTFDDEYSYSPDPTNPWLASKTSTYAGSRLMYECKVAMPDKIVSLYSYGYMISKELSVVDGVTPGEYCDYAVADYGLSAEPGTGMTLKQCSGMSIELRANGGNSSEDLARSYKENGYGYYMFFALYPDDYSTHVPRCQTVCKGLYEEELIAPTYYYEQYSTEKKTVIYNSSSESGLE